MSLNQALGYTSKVIRSLLLLVCAVACGGPQQNTGVVSPLTDLCAKNTQWDGSQCTTPSNARQMVREAKLALENFDVAKAIPLLEAAVQAGPHQRELLIELHEQRGIAYSYLKRESDALQAFADLLVLEPGHLLKYTLSPQATFLYERARKSHAEKAQPLLVLSWPPNLQENQDVPLVVEVLADPRAALKRMALYVRSSEQGSYKRVALDLPKPGEQLSFRLPAAHTKRPTLLQLYGSAYNAKGDEVLLWFDAKRPREIPLAYQAPTPWYRKTWVLATIGGVVAVGTGTAAYYFGVEPADTVRGGFQVGE